MAIKDDQKLADAQRDLAGYDPDEALRKAMGDDSEDDEPDGDEGDEDGESEDAGGDDEDGESDGDEGDEDGESEDEPPPPPANKKASSAKGAPMRRSRHNAEESAEALLKSLLLDPAGNPKPTAEVIEVSDVLTDFADALAKSHGETMAEIGAVQLMMDQVLPLLKAMGRHMIAQNKRIRQLEAGVEGLVKSVGTTQPHPGVGISLKKRLPAGDGAPPAAGSLSKSVVAAGLQVAYNTRAIDANQYRAAAGTLDSQGVDAALARLPNAVVEEIRKYSNG